MFENVIDTTKMSLILYYYVHSLIYHYLPCDQQIMLTRFINKTFLFNSEVLIYLPFNTYISGFSNLYNTHQSLSLESQTRC